jgi:hypothetical protein
MNCTALKSRDEPCRNGRCSDFYCKRINYIGINVLFLQSNPNFGFKAAVALKHTTVGASISCGNNSMFFVAKFEQEEFVLHSKIIASVCFKFGRPALYQHGSVTQLPSPGLNVLIVPVKFVHVKSFMTTVELFGLPTTVPFSSCV